VKLDDVGYHEELEKLRIEYNLDESEIGRVVAEHKERYIVRAENGELDAEITGNLRFSARSREDFPAVGDWVALAIHDSDFAIIHKILPRFSVISRQAVGQLGERQIIATNIDYALLILAVDRDFSINRIERYLAICFSSKVSPIIVLTKTDLLDEQKLVELLGSVKQRIQNVPVIAISNETQDGYGALRTFIKKGKTYCMLGSSGVGKSTLLNNLSGRSVMKTDAISASTHKGRHVTTHRELIVLEQGGILIDNPGMREVGVGDAGEGLAATFGRVAGAARHCRFKDCTHTHEAGCAVLEAVAEGVIDKGAYENYLKMKREEDHYEASVAERRKRDKDFGKMLKNYKKDLRKGG
jgi:ribosome biogenesis GTPase